MLLGVFSQCLIFQAWGYIDASLQMQLGNPSNATADTNNHDHYLIQRPIEAVDYNDNRGLPNWASWDLTADDANGAVERQDSFAPDTNLPASFHLVGANDYAHSGYDRGHLCPSADRTDNTNDNDMTFLMDNMMPQTGDNNSGVWNNFESYCRGLVTGAGNNELLIICGPSGFTGGKINTNGYVYIPQYTWKIAVVVPPAAGAALTRIAATNRVIAIKVPNTNGVSSVWQNFITSAAQIEVDTDLTFFTALPPDIANVLRNKVDGQTNPPPVIYAFSPTSGAASTNVLITGTNFMGASAVTFNGADALFTVDSGTQISATVPTNGSSGFISVTTPSGTAVTASNFTFYNNGGTVYSGTLIGWDTSTLGGGNGNYGPSILPPTTNAPNLISAGLIRGSGIVTNGNMAASGSWGGLNFTNTTETYAIASNKFAVFSAMAVTGYKVSFTSISRFDYRRSNTGPTSGVLQYRIGSGVFLDITNLTYVISNSTPASLGAIDLTRFAPLQNVGGGTNITFRIVNYLGSGSGGSWYISDQANSSAPDLAVQGTVTQVLTTNAPASVPGFSLAGFTNHEFQFTVSGTAGSNYVVQATAALNPADWISLATNSAPFVFIDTNQFSQRYYRSLVAP